jgi:hypothetical protein
MDGWYWTGGLDVAIWGTLGLKILTNIVLNVRAAMKEDEK